MSAHETNYRVHDLVKVKMQEVARSTEALPEWLAASGEETLWAVVRRTRALNGSVPIGLRGSTRNQRWAAEIPATSVLERLSPKELRSGKSKAGRIALPALDLLAKIEGLLSASFDDWGPTGSVGYELATDCLSVSVSSDLDLAIFVDGQEKAGTLRQLWTELQGERQITDCLVETTAGGFSLKEFCQASGGRILVRSADGPYLSSNPWSVEVSCV